VKQNGLEKQRAEGQALILTEAVETIVAIKSFFSSSSRKRLGDLEVSKKNLA